MPRGSKPGERRGGRAKGTPNKITSEIKAIAQQYGQEAIETIVSIMTNGESEQARLAASKELLDRAYGKAQQHTEVSGADGEPFVIKIVRFGETDGDDNSSS